MAYTFSLTNNSQRLQRKRRIRIVNDVWYDLVTDTNSYRWELFRSIWMDKYLYLYRRDAGHL